MNAPSYLFFFVLSSSLKLIYTQKIREDQSKGRDSDVGNKKTCPLEETQNLVGRAECIDDGQSIAPSYAATAPTTSRSSVPHRRYGAPQVSHAREEREAAALAAASCRY